MSWIKDWMQRVKERNAANNPENMTEEQRIAHEKFLQELTEKNKRTVRLVTTCLWCLAMVAWAVVIVMDVVHSVSPITTTFHGLGAVVTALLALPRVLRWLDARKQKKDEDAES